LEFTEKDAMDAVSFYRKIMFKGTEEVAEMLFEKVADYKNLNNGERLFLADQLPIGILRDIRELEKDKLTGLVMDERLGVAKKPEKFSMLFFVLLVATIACIVNHFFGFYAARAFVAVMVLVGLYKHMKKFGEIEYGDD
jgi:hypothetical protein